MKNITKTFLRTMGALSLAIGGSFFVSGVVGINLSPENLVTNVMFGAIGLIFMALFFGIEMGLAVYEEINRKDAGG